MNKFIETVQKQIELEVLQGMSLEEINNALRTLNTKLEQATSQNVKVTEQNRSLQGNLAAQRETLINISKNEQCVCSSDGTCQPQRAAMRTLAGEGGELTKKIIDFLTEMSSQDNRGTAFPYIYTIADENERYEHDKYSGDCIMYDSHMWEIKDYIKEVNEYSDNQYDFKNMDDSDIDEFIENELEGDELYNGRFRKELDTYYEGVFFTESDAKEYLADTMNHHFGPNPRTYVDSMNKWNRTSKTTAFLTDLFNFFGVKIPPEMYYDNKDKAGA